MNQWIVVTTINAPTKAIRRIGELAAEGWNCVVVGDRKTPKDWAYGNVHYLDFDAQERRYRDLAALIPANHYSRKNLGYLYAMEQGAEVILETDDDNIPLEGFGRDISIDVTGDVVGGSSWINAYAHFTDALIWPRGNPLDTIHQAGVVNEVGVSACCPIQQYLADGDPDVDAIYRLLFRERLTFRQRDPIILAPGSWCSFNSQNTLFFRQAFPLLYLPCHVSFRMTDIWRSFVAQAGLWSQHQQLAFRSATVVQERNEHNLMRDFRDEVDGYLMNARIAEILASVRAESLPMFVRAAWQALHRDGIVKSEEVRIVDAWMDRYSAVESS
jgi:hypothetical protein